MVSLSNHEVSASKVCEASWFDKLTMKPIQLEVNACSTI